MYPVSYTLSCFSRIKIWLYIPYNMISDMLFWMLVEPEACLHHVQSIFGCSLSPQTTPLNGRLVRNPVLLLCELGLLQFRIDSFADVFWMRFLMNALWCSIHEFCQATEMAWSLMTPHVSRCRGLIWLFFPSCFSYPPTRTNIHIYYRIATTFWSRWFWVGLKFQWHQSLEGIY